MPGISTFCHNRKSILSRGRSQLPELLLAHRFALDLAGPLSSLALCSPRFTARVAPAAFCCAFDLAGILTPLRRVDHELAAIPPDQVHQRGTDVHRFWRRAEFHRLGQAVQDQSLSRITDLSAVTRITDLSAVRSGLPSTRDPRQAKPRQPRIRPGCARPVAHASQFLIQSKRLACQVDNPGWARRDRQP